MTFWRKLRRAFSTDVEAIVGAARVFGTDSECLDDGVEEVEALFEPLARMVAEHLAIERVQASEVDRAWEVRFRAAGREWRASFEPRDYGAVFRLVNEALHEARAPRRVHVVSSRRGQDFRVAFASVEDVADLLEAGWIVEPALPNVPHVLRHDGLAFHGDRPYRLSDRGSVIEADLAEPCTIEGVACAEGAVARDYEGHLTFAILAEEATFGRWTFPAGARVTFWEGGGRVPCEVEMPREHVLAGVPCAHATFHEDGSIESIDDADQ